MSIKAERYIRSCINIANLSHSPAICEVQISKFSSTMVKMCYIQIFQKNVKKMSTGFFFSNFDDLLGGTKKSHKTLYCLIRL